jgi:hypothetical protein
MRYVFLLVLALATLCPAQQTNPEYTGGLPNGRFWNVAAESGQTYYLLGVRDAESLAGANGDWWAKGFTIGDYRKEIDKLYSETENINIPIIWAFRYCTNKLRGEVSRANLEVALRNLRQMALNIVTK